MIKNILHFSNVLFIKFQSSVVYSLNCLMDKMGIAMYFGIHTHDPR